MAPHLDAVHHIYGNLMDGSRTFKDHKPHDLSKEACACLITDIRIKHLALEVERELPELL